MLFGCAYGIVLTWGPIISAFIGLFSGVIFGLIIKLFIVKKFSDRRKSHKATEVFLIIECNETQAEMVKDTLWEHYALGVRKFDLLLENS